MSIRRLRVRVPSVAPFYPSVIQWKKFVLLKRKSQVRILPGGPWLHHLMVRILPFQGRCTSSNLVGVTKFKLDLRIKISVCNSVEENSSSKASVVGSNPTRQSNMSLYSNGLRGWFAKPVFCRFESCQRLHSPT